MKKNSGFTLMELLTVIAVIIILAGFLMPALSRARRQARRVECINNLKQVGIALQSYALDYNGNFPSDLSDLTTDYLSGQNAILICPEGGAIYVPNPAVTNISVSANAAHVRCPNNPHLGPNQINVLFVDGHVGSTNTAPW